MRTGSATCADRCRGCRKAWRSPTRPRDAYGGAARFTYRRRRSGSAACPRSPRSTPTYDDVDLTAFTNFLELQGIRLAGRASGRNLLEWPLGRFAEHRGEGAIAHRPPGVQTMTREMTAAQLAARRGAQPRLGRVQQPAACGAGAGPGGAGVHLRARVDRHRAEPAGDARDVRRARGAHGVRRSIADQLSRHQRRLAGKRSRCLPAC